MSFQIFVLLSAMTVSSFAVQLANISPSSENALSDLTKVMAKRNTYLEQRMAKDAALSRDFRLTEDIDERVSKANALGFRYTTINIDSADYYYGIMGELANELNDKSLQTVSEAHKVSLLTLRGDILPAVELFEKIDSAKLRPEHIGEYYTAGSRLYLAYALYNNTGTDSSDSITMKGREFAVKYLATQKEDSIPYNYVSAVIAMIDGRYAKSTALLSDVIENAPDDSPYKPWSEELLAIIKMNNDREEEAIAHLANAAALDIKMGSQVSNSARLLSKLLMQTGDYEMADKLLELAIDNALTSGDRMKYTQAATLAPGLADTFKKSGRWYRWWLGVSLVLCLVLILIIVWLLGKSSQNKKLTQIAQKKLKDADAVRIHYFNNFLNMCAVYMERLDEYRRMTHRKLKAGQVDDLYKMLKSGEMLEEQTIKFDQIFDGAFLQAYPNFVKEINRLLLPDKQLEAPDSESLGTDLRLLAFMRLGFDDSAQIARFMGLSINTIYAYRNRLRSRAIDRDAFESDIMKIGQTI
jgi:hypothetical protein